MIIYININ